MSQPPDYITPFAQAAQLPTPDIGGSFLQGIHQSLQQRFGMAQMQVQMAQQQQALSAQQAALADPTPANILKWGIADPSHYEAVKSSHDTMTSDAQKQDVQDAASIYGYLGAGDTDGASKILQQRVDAGQSNLAPLLQAVQSGDPAKVKAAQATAGMILAGKMGPDKFAETYKAIGEEGRANAEEPGKLAAQPVDLAHTQAETTLATAQAHNITNPRPETAAVTDPTTGRTIFYNKNGSPEAARAAAGEGGTPVDAPPGIAALVPSLIASENSSGDPNAKNPRSSATGNGQFLNGTWLGMVKQYRPDLAEGKSDTQILAMRADPNLSREMTTQYAVQNAGTLQAANLPVNGATIAMAHKLGPGGAQAVLQANPGAPLAKVLPADVIAANPQLKGMTAGQYAQGLAQKFGVQQISTAGVDPGATGDDFLKTLPSARQGVIKAMADGRLPVPTGSAARSAANQTILSQLAQYDPTFDFSNSNSRRATRLNFTSGKASNEVKALNTAIGHLGSLDDAIDHLGNYGLPLNNAAAHLIAGATGTDARVKTFEITKNAALDEVSKVFTGSGGALADREGWKKQLNAASSPETLHAVVAQLADLLSSRISALGEQYNQGMGSSKDGIELLTPHSQAAFARLGKSKADRSQGGGSVQATAKDVATLKGNPKLAGQFDQLYGPGAAAQYLGAR